MLYVLSYHVEYAQRLCSWILGRLRLPPKTLSIFFCTVYSCGHSLLQIKSSQLRIFIGNSNLSRCPLFHLSTIAGGHYILRCSGVILKVTKGGFIFHFICCVLSYGVFGKRFFMESNLSVFCFALHFVGEKPFFAYTKLKIFTWFCFHLYLLCIWSSFSY